MNNHIPLNIVHLQFNKIKPSYVIQHIKCNKTIVVTKSSILLPFITIVIYIKLLLFTKPNITIGICTIEQKKSI